MDVYVLLSRKKEELWKGKVKRPLFLCPPSHLHEKRVCLFLGPSSWPTLLFPQKNPEMREERTRPCIHNQVLDLQAAFFNQFGYVWGLPFNSPVVERGREVSGVGEREENLGVGEA